MIVIEGVIGAGKTTMGRAISNALAVPFHEELIGNRDLLKVLNLFYSDQERWACLTQVNFLTQMYKRDCLMPTGVPYGVFDRSLYGVRVFTKHLYRMGFLIIEEFETLREIYEHLLVRATPPRLLVHLYCSPEVALQRVKSRGRDYERSVTLKYLEGLASCYDDWFVGYSASPKLRIDYTDISPQLFDQTLQEIITAYEYELDRAKGGSTKDPDFENLL